MKAEELIEKLEALAPRRLALSWDNPGLICGRREKEVKKILIALDATADVVERAISEGCDMLLTHHPMIFKEVRQINDETALGEKLLRLIGADVCCYAMHTNFDAAPGCMADLVCERMGIVKEAPLEPSFTKDGEPAQYGIGFVGSFVREMRVPELAAFLKERFGLNGVTYYDTKKTAKRAAVCPGSGRGMLALAKQLSADVFITGDMGHHDGIDALDMGLSLIDAGHYGLEHIFTEFMQDYLKKECKKLTLLTDETDVRHFA